MVCVMSVCNRDCLNCIHPDCICDELYVDDYREIKDRESTLLFPKSMKQKQIAAYKKAYYAENKEQIAACQKAYYAENKEQIAAYKKAYYAEKKRAALDRRKVNRK